MVGDVLALAHPGRTLRGFRVACQAAAQQGQRGTQRNAGGEVGGRQDQAEGTQGNVECVGEFRQRIVVGYQDQQRAPSLQGRGRKRGKRRDRLPWQLLVAQYGHQG